MQVIRFLENGILLMKPEDCPDVIYQIMLGTWRADPRSRLDFSRVHRDLLEYKQNVTNQPPENPSDNTDSKTTVSNNCIVQVEAVV